MRATVQEAERFLADNPELKTINIILSDLNGVLRGKMIRPDELLTIFRHGRPLPSSLLALTTRGDDVLETGLVWEVGDADGLAFPIANTLKRCPWSAVPCAQVLMSLEDAAIGAVTDPRRALTRVIDGMAADGLIPVMAAELEFYLLDKERDVDGRIQIAKNCKGLRPIDSGTYTIKVLDDFTPFLHALYDACTAMDLPAETAISEFAPGQMEITLHHRIDAMQAMDEAVQYKRTVKMVAEQFGMVACFMPKPFAGQSGSGLHMHLSINDKQGRNLCAGAGDNDLGQGGSVLQRQAIAGMAATMAEAMLLFAPNANSYRRFRRHSYAPLAPTWGINNRTVSLRVPTGPAISRHIEHRVCGADANLYLAAAAILAGAHHGIKNQLDPGVPVTGNGYHGVKRSLPEHWHVAIETFRRSAFIREYFGEQFVHVYGAIKTQECDEFFGAVTELDFDWYLGNV